VFEVRYNLAGEVPQQKAKAYLDKLIAKGAQVEIVEKRKPRTRNQNAYFWALMSLFGVDTGYTKDEASVVFKRKLGMVYEKEGQKFLRSTASLDVKEMTQYIEKVRNYSALQGIYLPSADEYWTNANDYNQIIDQNSPTL
jgi:hypothetical protein